MTEQNVNVNVQNEQQTQAQQQQTGTQFNIDNPVIKFEALEKTFSDTPEGKLLKPYLDKVKNKYLNKGEEGFKLALEVAANLYEMEKTNQPQQQEQQSQQAQTQQQTSQPQQPQQQAQVNQQTQQQVDRATRPQTPPMDTQEQRKVKTWEDVKKNLIEHGQGEYAEFVDKVLGGAFVGTDKVKIVTDGLL